MNAALSVDALLAEAMNFSPDNRLELAERLVASVPAVAEIESAQIEEISRRMADDRSGKTVRIPGDEALRQVRKAVLGNA